MRHGGGRVSLTVYSPKRNRAYVRRFDHEEAARRHAAGESVKALADEYGVTYAAVHHAVTPGEKARQVEMSRRWRTGVCETCGGPAMRLVSGKKAHNPDGRCLCRSCRFSEMREHVRFGVGGTLVAVCCAMLDCANGERWQPPENFPRGQRYPDLRAGGFHTQCRACNTRARQSYRERHRVPCESCGAPCLPPSEKGARLSVIARCRDCYLADVSRTPEAVTSEAMPATEGLEP